MLTEPKATARLDELYARPAYITGIQSFLDESDHVRALSYWIGEFASADRLDNADDVVQAIQRSIADIDCLINDQINEIIHHERFQALESSWRGLSYLTQQVEGVKHIKIKVLDASWNEVSRDISRALEFDQSHLFRKIYSEEYGTPGGEPYGVVIGDYEVSHRTSQNYNDVATLQGMAQIAAASFAPFIAAAAPELFGLDDFSGLAQPLDLHDIFAQQEYIKWRAFRSQVDSQFVGLVLPHILMRLPYRKTPGSYRGIYFHEKIDNNGHQNYCWGNAVYGLAAILIREFASVGWFGHMRGVPRNQIGGGLLTTLPCDSFESDPENVASKPVTDVVITDARERELGDLGLIALCQCYDTPFAAFYSNQSLRKIERAATREIEANAKLSAMLQHVLCGSRIAHYIKVIIRDKVGSFITAEECEDFLREWLFKYTTGREDLEWEEQAQYPLREAAVNVRDHPEKPGDYICVIHLRPHYQLDNMVSELELVTELAQSA